MSIYDDNEEVRKDFNFTNSTSLPNTYITPVNGVYTFSYNFLSSKTDLENIDQDNDGTNDYDVLESGESDIPANQSIEYDTFSAFTSVQEDAAKIIMHEKAGYDYTYSNFFSDVTKVVFSSDTPEDAHIAFGQVEWSDGDPLTFNDDDVAGYIRSVDPVDITDFNNSFPGYDYSTAYDEGAHGDVWLNSDFTSGWSSANEGGVQFYTILHELGHSLGLVHPSTASGIDNLKYTIMSSNLMSGFGGNNALLPSGLQLYDIAAIQEIYDSRNYTTRNGDTRYAQDFGFSSTSTTPFIYTIWDGDGDDIIEADGYNTHSAVIDLRQGAFSSIGQDVNGNGAVDNVAVAFYTVIEDAWGTTNTAGDILVGNAWNNTIYGDAGDDWIFGDGVSADGSAGFHENDTDRPGPDADSDDSGDDVLIGGNGDDVLWGGRGDDTLHGGFQSSDMPTGWNDGGYFTGLSNITESTDGDDTANYSRFFGYTDITLTSDGEGTVDKYWNLTDAVGLPDSTDDFYSIEKFVFGGLGGTLTGTGGDDDIEVEGDGTVNGGAGADTITTGNGNQVLKGGAGADTYIMDASTSSGVKYMVNDGGDTQSDTFTITGVSDASDVKLIQIGDHLTIIDTLLDRVLAFFADHFSGSGEIIETLEIDDGTTTTVDLTSLTSALLAKIYESVSQFITNTLADFGIIESIIWDPLVIDLDNDGISTDAVGFNHYFDLNADGFAERTGWIGGDDGFLVRDVNANGRIDNGSEMFGDATTDGFTALAAHDSNSDGVINASDTIWSDLEIWQDKNSDGQTQSDELLTLASQNITSIDVQNVTETSIALTAGSITHTGTVTTTTGTLAAGNYAFDVDETNSVYVADYDFDIRTAFLPNIRGYAQMADLQIATSIDNDETDAASLIAILQDITSYNTAEVFENYDTIKDLVKDMMFRWAGVENVLPGSRGAYMTDAQKLEFLENYLGNGFFDTNLNSTSPGAAHAVELEAMFEGMWLRMTGKVLIQSSAGALLDGTYNYNALTDSYEGTMSLTQSVLDELEAYATALSTTAERKDFWLGVADFLNGLSINANGDEHARFGLSMADEALLDTAIEASDSTLTWYEEDHDPNGTGVESIQYRYYSPVGDIITGTSGDDSALAGGADDDIIEGLAGADTITGSAGFDILYGHSEDGIGDDGAADILHGNDGDDRLYGGDGDDTLTDGLGNDQLYGGNGNDLIIAGANDPGTQDLAEGGAGDDTYRVHVREVFIVDTSGTDTLEFTQYPQFGGFDINDFAFENVLGVGLRMTSKSTSEVGFNVVLANQFDDLSNASGVGVEYIKLSAGLFDLKNYLLNTFTGPLLASGTSFDDTITGLDGVTDYIFGFDGNDTLSGLSGDDEINGYAGDDTLDGGDGDDEIQGNDGNDTYVLSAGLDTYYENGSGGAAANADDKILFGSGETLQDFSIYHQSGNLVIQKDASNKSTFVNHFNTNTFIENFVLDDGTIIDPTTLNYETHGTDNGENLFGLDTTYAASKEDVMYGFGGNDTIFTGSGSDIAYGGDGDDTLLGEGGADVLYGEAGNDILNGDKGSDTYVYSAGLDTVIDNRDNDVIIFDAAFDISDLTFTNTGADDVTIVINAGTDEVEVDKQRNASTLFHIETIQFSDGETLNFADYANWIYGSSGTTNGTTGNDTMLGDNSTNTLNGLQGDDEIHGLDGDDTIYGAWGDDVIYGNDGADLLKGWDGQDLIYGGAGDDDIYGENDDDILYGGAGNDYINGGSGNDLLYGEAGDDELIGGAQMDTIYGGADDDTISGAASDDTLYGDAGEDDIDGGSGADTLYGGSGNDELSGFSGNDTLYGEDGADTLYGETGRDFLYGGNGADILYGGGDDSKDDRFIFEANSAFDAVDTIKDFWSGQDKIDISDVLDGFYTEGVDDLEDFVALAVSGGHTTISIDQDGVGGVFTDIVTVESTTWVDVDDFKTDAIV